MMQQRSAEPGSDAGDQSTVRSDYSSDLSAASPSEIRRMIRHGRLHQNTAGMSLGYLQGNVVILQAEHAMDFFRYCQRNPKPCPLVGVSDTGAPQLPTLGRDLDIRTDVSLYNIYRNGEIAEQVTDIAGLWQDDFVTFILGCSFSFEQALMAEGVRFRHIEQNTTVAMYRTNIETAPAGKFSGNMVVSMRPLSVSDTIRAVEITSRFSQAHGSPVHFGDGQSIGIADLASPDWGDVPEIQDGEIPVFWACGVTPRLRLETHDRPSASPTRPGECWLPIFGGWMRGASMFRIFRPERPKIHGRILTMNGYKMFGKAALCAAAITVGAMPALAQETTQINVIGTWNSMTNYTDREAPFWRGLTKETGGAIISSIGSYSEFGLSGFEIMRFLRSGVFDYAYGLPSYVAAEDAIFEGGDLSSVTQDIETERAVADGYFPTLSKSFEEIYDAKLLQLYPFPSQILFCKSEITGLADLKGKKIRV